MARVCQLAQGSRVETQPTPVNFEELKFLEHPPQILKIKVPRDFSHIMSI